MWFIRHLHAIAKKTPEKKVTLLTRPRSCADLLIQNDPYIEEVIWLHVKPGEHDGFWGTWRLGQLLKGYDFREAWVLHSRTLRYPLACWLAQIPQIKGPGIGLQKYILNSGPYLMKDEQKTHPLKRADLLLEKQKIPFLSEKSPLKIPSSRLKEIKDRYKGYKKPWVCLGISSSEVPKKWPADSYIDLALRLDKKIKGTIFILGGNSEKEEAAYIQKKLQKKKISVQVVIGDLWASLSVLSFSKFIVGNDTGITHAAPMVGSKGLVLLGKAQVPIHYYTLLEGLRAASTNEVEGKVNNMEEIFPGDVVEKLKSLGWVS